MRRFKTIEGVNWASWLTLHIMGKTLTTRKNMHDRTMLYSRLKNFNEENGQKKLAHKQRTSLPTMKRVDNPRFFSRRKDIFYWKCQWRFTNRWRPMTRNVEGLRFLSSASSRVPRMVTLPKSGRHLHFLQWISKSPPQPWLQTNMNVLLVYPYTLGLRKAKGVQRTKGQSAWWWSPTSTACPITWNKSVVDIEYR